jgi:2-keto-3-deoxy-6-phosphogluconate aldolase
LSGTDAACRQIIRQVFWRHTTYCEQRHLRRQYGFGAVRQQIWTAIGCATASEAFTALNAGAHALKIFTAQSGTDAACRQIIRQVFWRHTTYCEQRHLRRQQQIWTAIGCATASEAFTALNAGAHALKIFPASALYRSLPSPAPTQPAAR